MALRGGKLRQGRSDFLPIAAVIVVGIALSIFMFVAVRGYYTDAAQQQFSRNVTYYGTTFKNAVERHVTSLASIHAFVSASHDVNRWEFSAFANQTLPQNSGFKAVLWLPYLDQKERKTFEARLQKDGLFGLQIRELTKAGELVSAKSRPSYLPVAYVEPFEGNGGLIGVDLSNDSIYAPLFRASQNSGRVAASTPSTQALVEGARLPIVLVAFPLVPPVAEGVKERPRPDGYALGVLQLDRVIDDAIGDAAPLQAAIAYGSGKEPSVYLPGEKAKPVSLDTWFGNAAYRQSVPFDVAGQKFVLVLRSLPQSDILTQLYAPAGAGLLVFVITALLVQSMATTVFQKHLVEKKVVERTTELSALNIALGDEVLQRRNAEAALTIARDKAESANRAKSAFLATMSHELRTPLNAIIGFSSILTGERALPEAQSKDYAREINVSGVKLLDLINDVLDITQIDTQDAQAEDYIVLSDVIEAVIAKTRPLAQAASITIHTAVPQDLPVLRGDTKRIGKALFNLLNNAVKFGKPGGRAHITARTYPHGLEIDVVDDGVGMPPGAEANIVGLFSQGDFALARHHEGIGLGLTYVRRVADQHGAKLNFSSKEGVGTRVSLVFPADRLVPAQARNVA